MTKSSRKRKATDQAADGNHKAYRASETKGTRAGDCGCSVENGEVSSARQSTPPPYPNRFPRSRRSRSAAKLKNKEDEEIFADTESQQFLELIKYGDKNKESSNKANEFLIDFKKHLRARHGNLDSDAREREARLTSQREKFIKSFRDVYSHILSTETTNQSSDQPLEPGFDSSAHMLLQKSMNVIMGASSLIGQFRSCRVKLAYQQTSMSVDHNWEDGAKNLKYILDIGRQIGERKLDNILRGSRESPVRCEVAEASELLYGRDEPHAQGETWAEVVRKQEKGVMKLVNSLPQS